MNWTEWYDSLGDHKKEKTNSVKDIVEFEFQWLLNVLREDGKVSESDLFIAKDSILHKLKEVIQ